MDDKDRVFARFQDDKPEAPDRRELLIIPRRAAASGSRVVEVVHVRSGGALKERPRRVATHGHAASWDNGFPAKRSVVTPKGEPRDSGELVRAITSGEDDDAPIAALAMRYLKGGMADAQVMLTLRGLMESVPEEIRDLKDGVLHPLRWQARYNDIPRAVSTARAEINADKAKAASDDVFGAARIGEFRLDAMTAGFGSPRRP